MNHRWRCGPIKVDSISDSSRISFGTNISYGHQSIDKSSEAFGALHGDANAFEDNVEMVMDVDAIDGGQTNSLSFGKKTRSDYSR